MLLPNNKFTAALKNKKKQRKKLVWKPAIIFLRKKVGWKTNEHRGLADVCDATAFTRQKPVSDERRRLLSFAFRFFCFLYVCFDFYMFLRQLYLMIFFTYRCFCVSCMRALGRPKPCHEANTTWLINNLSIRRWYTCNMTESNSNNWPSIVSGIVICYV